MGYPTPMTVGTADPPCRGSLRALLAAGLMVAAAAPAWAVDGPHEYRRLMHPKQFEQMSPEAQQIFAGRMLGPVRAEIVAGARQHSIPPRLLAACLLNELIDYSLVDLGQEFIPNAGSVGIAQINVTTAIRHGLVDLTEEEIRREEMRAAAQGGGSRDPVAHRRGAIERLTWLKLTQPAIAVEAAAREISWILDRANENLGHVWPRSLLRGPIDRRDPYATVRMEDPLEIDPKKVRINKERSLALLVCAAYNTDTILGTDFSLDNPFAPVKDRQAPFYNARNHGVNAYDLVAEMLATGGWFTDVDPVRPERLEPQGQRRLELRCSRPGAAASPECQQVRPSPIAPTPSPTRQQVVDCDEYARSARFGDPDGWRRFCEYLQQQQRIR